MSDCVGWATGRALPRLALAGLGAVLLAGCSSDVTRFTQSDSPFSNPFVSNTPAAAPAPRVASAPLPQGSATAVRTASLPRPQAVGGSAAGWTAAGGSSVVVGNGETLDSLSGRYGVPAAAILSANGLSSASEVKSGMHIILPVYHADGHGLATAGEKTARKREKDVAEAEPSKSAKKGKEKEKEKTAEKVDKP